MPSPLQPVKAGQTGITFLPFLYNTATIRRSVLEFNSRRSFSSEPFERYSLRSRNTQRSHGIIKRPLCGNLQQRNYIPMERSSNASDVDTTDIPLEDQNTSTLTDEEKKAFTSLLDKIQKAEQKDDIQKLRRANSKTKTRKGPEDVTQYSQINSILQKAMERQMAGGQGPGKSPLADLPSALKTLMAARRQTLRLDHKPEVDTEELSVNRAQDKEYERVNKAFSKAKTDVELWEILEKHVFSRVEALNTDSDIQRRAEVVKKLRKNIKNTKQHAKRIKEAEEAAQKAETHKTAGLALLGPNYSAWLVRAMRILRSDFLSSSLALTILPKVKSLGIASYAMGASTMLYNELISIYWQIYQDFDGIDALLREMEVGGLDYDGDTLDLLEKINRQNTRAFQGEYGPAIWELSRMDAWQRRRNMMYQWSDVVRQRLEANALRLAAEREAQLEAEEREKVEALLEPHNDSQEASLGSNDEGEPAAIAAPA